MHSHDNSVHTSGSSKGNTTTAPLKRTVAYVRVSTDEQAREGYSLADQERAARLYAQAHVATHEPGWTEIADGEAGVYADPGISGALRERPGLSRLLADAKAGKIGRVICTRLDRIGRTASIILSIEDDLDAVAVQRIYIKDSIDTSTPTGRLLRTVLAAVAELERDMILERTSAGRDEALRCGAVYRHDVLGYRYVASNRKNGQLAGVDVDDAGAALVRRIFTTVANGTSLHALAHQLNAEGVPTLRGAGMWRAATLRKIVVNPLYTGHATYGRMRTVKTEEGRRRPTTEPGKVTYTTRPSDPAHVQYIDAPPIVSPELAQAAQDMLARNRITAKRNTKHDYLLGGGLLRCAALLPDGRPCGSVMRGESRPAPRAPRYRCSHVEPTGYLTHSIAAGASDETVWTALHATLTDTSTVLDDVKALADQSSTQAREAEAQIRATERAIAERDDQRDTLLNLHLTRHLDEDRFLAKDTALLEQQQRLRDQHAALCARRDAALTHRLPIAEIDDLCRRLAGRLDTLTFPQRQHIVRTLLTGVTADPAARTMHLDGVFDALSMTVAVTASDHDQRSSANGDEDTGDDGAAGGTGRIVNTMSASSVRNMSHAPAIPFTLTVPMVAAR